MLRYYVLLIGLNQLPLQNDLRWLLRRGSPLPIPNREVKPACADGTAVMWESMSSPFFREPFTKVRGFCFIEVLKIPEAHWASSSYFQMSPLLRQFGLRPSGLYFLSQKYTTVKRKVSFRIGRVFFGWSYLINE